MPELPEVETVVRDLRPRLVGRKIRAVKVGIHSLRRNWQPHWSQSVQGQRIETVDRRGKWILIKLRRNQHLVLHLGMTGQLRVLPADEPAANHTHLIFALDQGRQELRFRDIRRFGSATLFEGQSQLDQFFLESALGPEPFDLDAHYWRERLAGTSRCLKAVLLDQTVIAGVGNIYADEALFEARLHPARIGRSLNTTQSTRLRRAIETVLRKAIEKRGSTIRNYVGGSGIGGQFQREFRVYGQTGKPCPRCHGPIECIRLAGRSTHFCPRCQQAS